MHVDSSLTCLIPLVHNQLTEMDVIKTKIYQLESTHMQIKNK